MPEKKGFTVSVGNTFPSSYPNSFNPKDYDACAVITGSLAEGTEQEVRCDDYLSGRYVALYTDQADTALSLCNVEIYGTPGKEE